MQTNLLSTNKIVFGLLFTLIAILIMVANYFGHDYAIWTYNLINLAITAPLVVFSTLLMIRERFHSTFGKAWIFFTVFVILWFIAERIWTVYDLVYKVNPFPSEADIFWIAAYPFYFIFTVYYLKPFKSIISVKVGIITSGVTITVAIFFMYYISMQESTVSGFETILGLVYPMMDTIALVPIMIGLFLFFRGQVNFLWSCMLIGVLCFVVADFGWLVFMLDDTYYSGHPIDIIYIWAYLFLLYGTYDHNKIFKKRNQENRFNDQDKFR